jgi:hypothetical protein
MRAQIELYWLNPITYRTVIHSPSFTQMRIVNGNVIEEHNTGDFYPRWLQNFNDALLNPIPKAPALRKIPGTVPVGAQAHACISNPGRTSAAADQFSAAQVCFQDSDPKLAGGIDSTRSVWFGDFAPFGQQQIPRTLVNSLPENLLVRGKVTLLEPLRQSHYALLKAHEFTPGEKQLRTTEVSKEFAESLLEYAPGRYSAAGSDNQATLYVRTDRTGRVREAYRDSSGSLVCQDAAIVDAMQLRFKPLLVHGVAQQMETSVQVSVPKTLSALSSQPLTGTSARSRFRSARVTAFTRRGERMRPLEMDTSAAASKSRAWIDPHTQPYPQHAPSR